MLLRSVYINAEEKQYGDNEQEKADCRDAIECHVSQCVIYYERKPSSDNLQLSFVSTSDNSFNPIIE